MNYLSRILSDRFETFSQWEFHLSGDYKKIITVKNIKERKCERRDNKKLKIIKYPV